MRFRLNLLLIFVFFTILLGSLLTYAQTVHKHTDNSAAKARQHASDSTRNARQHIIDSTRDARQQIMDSTRTARQEALKQAQEARKNMLDSMKEVRQHKLDSMKAARKHVTDSLMAIRRYRESKHYKDSVIKVRTVRANALKAKRKAYFDSLKVARQHSIDSMLSARKAVIDKMRAVQKKRADSLGRIRKYRESRHYRDSVLVFRKARLDSIRVVRKHYSDSVLKYRKHFSDSLTKQRKHVMDSVTKVRTKFLDSLKVLRKKRTDSLAAAKDRRDKQLKAEQKRREQKMQMALDLKIKHKREAWSNEKMLKKKWTLKRQIIQNTFTRYNYYFNANRKMDEALANMLRVRRENYDTLIGLYPFDPDRDSSLLAPDMDSIIHKVSVGIQIHDPRTKWGDDLYLLLGQAYYYKGRYEDATTAFHYIISMDERKKKKPAQASHTANKTNQQPSIVEAQKKTLLDFMKHKPVHNDAILWLARTFTQARQPEKTESVLSLLESDPKFPPNLKGRLAMEEAFLELNGHDYKHATEQLTIAADDNNMPGWIRLRAAFLCGQLQQREGAYKPSVESFKKVLDLNPKIDMDFYARKYLAYGTMYGGGDTKDAIAALKSVLNDGKYATYYEQVYFMLGRIAASQNDTKNAITYLESGIHTQKTTRKQKAISFAALGSVYYASGNYIAANHAYDSAATMASSAPGDSLVALAVVRGKALDAVTGPATTIHDQDSLLALALMTEKEQRAVVRKYIRHLQDLRNDSIYRAENAGISSVAAATPEENSASTPWYFSNAARMQQGVNEFKSKWGTRPLVDNWRRMAAIGLASNSSSNNAGSDTAEGNSNLDENGLPTEESLLAEIPNTPEEQQKSYGLIQKAYVALANAYVKDLEDYPLAVRTIDTFEKRFPANDQKAQMLYLRYLIALRQSDLDKAKELSQQILTDYPESEYAKLVRPTEDGAGVPSPNGVSVASYYDETYGLLLQHQYTDVLMRVDQAEKLYKDPAYAKRFHIMKAISLASTGEYGMADTLLTEFLRVNPSDSLRAWADAVLNYITKNRPAPTTTRPAPVVNTAGNNMGSISKTLNNGTPANQQGDKRSQDANNNTNNANNASNPNLIKGYTYNPSEQHYCVVALPGLESRAMGIKAAITDFNTFRFSNEKLVLNMDVLNPKQALVVIKAFYNATTAKIYLSAIKGTSQIFRDYSASEYQIFIISASNYTKLFSDRSVQYYLQFYKANYK